MATYKHDPSYDILKRINEQVTKNYTSSQYLKTLDHFLWMAMTPVVRSCPSLFLNYASKVIAQQVVRNNKMTSDDKTEAPVAFINTLLATDKVTAAKALHLNRGILFAFLSVFVELTRAYRIMKEQPAPADSLEYSNALLETKRIENLVGLLPGHSLYGTILEVTYWLKEATDFKNVIVEKYTRMVINAARRAYIDCQHQKDLGDIIGIFMITLSKAIDRCDSRHGVLTTFITNWLRGARSQVMEAVSEDHKMTSLEARVEAAGEQALDEYGYESADTTYEAVQALSYIARRIDPKGCVRASLGIPEFVTSTQLRLLEAHKERAT